MTEEKKNKDSIFSLVITLCIIASIAASVLAVVDILTRQPRKEAALKTTLDAFKEIEPNFNNDPYQAGIFAVSDKNKWKILKDKEKLNEFGIKKVEFYPAKKDGKLISVLAKTTSPKGYGGNMVVLLSMTPNGTIKNVVITKHNETPGLGTAVTDRTVDKTIWGIINGKYKEEENELAPNPVLDYFNGKRYLPDEEYNKMNKRNPDLIPHPEWKVEKDGGEFEYITGATISSRAVTYGVKKIVSVYHDTKKQILEKFKN